MLSIKDLHAVEGKNILKGLNLEIREGEVHAIMGPTAPEKHLGACTLWPLRLRNYSRKRQFLGKDLLELDTEERAHLGLFLFSTPLKSPSATGVSQGVGGCGA